MDTEQKLGLAALGLTAAVALSPLYAPRTADLTVDGKRYHVHTGALGVSAISEHEACVTIYEGGDSLTAVVRGCKPGHLRHEPATPEDRVAYRTIKEALR